MEAWGRGYESRDKSTERSCGNQLIPECFWKGMRGAGAHGAFPYMGITTLKCLWNDIYMPVGGGVF